MIVVSTVRSVSYPLLSDSLQTGDDGVIKLQFIKPIPTKAITEKQIIKISLFSVDAITFPLVYESKFLTRADIVLTYLLFLNAKHHHS